MIKSLQQNTHCQCKEKLIEANGQQFAYKTLSKRFWYNNITAC